jgi:hypothetical protein
MGGAVAGDSLVRKLRTAYLSVRVNMIVCANLGPSWGVVAVLKSDDAHGVHPGWWLLQG